MKPYTTLLVLLLSVATVFAAESDAPSTAPLTSPVPAAAPIKADSLPSGRHKVSSYRNGSSIEVVVEDREIKSLKVDGKEVPEDEYSQHQNRVEELLGTSENGSRTGREMRMYRWSEDDLEGLEERLEGMGDDFERLGESFEFRFEGMGENFERMGERLGESFERMFNFESDGNVMRFGFRGDGDGNWHMDSLGNDRSFEWRSDGMDPKGLNPATPADGRNKAENEIREMETMIEQMERRKARMKAELEREKRDEARQKRDAARRERDQILQERDRIRQDRDVSRLKGDIDRESRDAAREEAMEERAERREASYEVLVEQLQREGLIEDSGRLRKLSVDAESLKVNGTKASKEGHARFLELYEQQTGRALSGNSSISIKID